MRFDKKLIDKARKYFYKVYVDRETEKEFIGSETAYEGVRVRVYSTKWDYEEAEIFRDNGKLAEYIGQYERRNTK